MSRERHRSGTYQREGRRKRGRVAGVCRSGGGHAYSQHPGQGSAGTGRDLRDPGQRRHGQYHARLLLRAALRLARPRICEHPQRVPHGGMDRSHRESARGQDRRHKRRHQRHHGPGQPGHPYLQGLAVRHGHAATRLRFETADLNDGLLLCEESSGLGEPVLAGLAPKTGAETGGAWSASPAPTSAMSRGSCPGNAPSPWLRSDAVKALLAVTPSGGAPWMLRWKAPREQQTLARGFTYFLPQVHLT